MLLESACAAALSTGSAICLWRLLFLLADDDGRSNNSYHEQQNQSDELLLALFFVSCSAGMWAVWSVKGPHACWHPWSGPSLWPSAVSDRCSPSTGARMEQSDGREIVTKLNDKDDELCAPSGEPCDRGDGRLERQSSFVVSGCDLPLTFLFAVVLLLACVRTSGACKGLCVYLCAS